MLSCLKFSQDNSVCTVKLSSCCQPCLVWYRQFHWESGCVRNLDTCITNTSWWIFVVNTGRMSSISMGLSMLLEYAFSLLLWELFGKNFIAVLDALVRVGFLLSLTVFPLVSTFFNYTIGCTTSKVRKHVNSGSLYSISSHFLLSGLLVCIYIISFLSRILWIKN